MCVYTYVYIYMYIYLNRQYKYIYRYIFLYVNIYTHENIYMCVNAFTYIYIICILLTHTHIYIWINMYIYILIYDSQLYTWHPIYLLPENAYPRDNHNPYFQVPGASLSFGVSANASTKRRTFSSPSSPMARGFWCTTPGVAPPDPKRLSNIG